MSADDIAISVENLSKSYLIHHQAAGGERYQTLRETMVRGVRGVGRRAADLARGQLAAEAGQTEEFWALKDVSFEVKRGEVLGIIGRNGAGKSTLLKILSRITEPTKGRVRIRGRVASLLEVGTGFHPELTGRENIFLNGAVLGMTRAEIRRKFDEIVAFAEVEKFLDTPVKRYSSGMYVRLAFAVAAHLDPEILVVDEVLAVGDADFQKKCLGKMRSISTESGRTVLFVSHNMSAVTSLCTTGLLLAHGQIRQTGPIGEVAAVYMKGAASADRVEFRSDPTRPSVDWAEVDIKALQRGDLIVRIGVSSPFPLRPLAGITLASAAGFPVWGSNSRFHPSPDMTTARKTAVLTCAAKAIPLAAGDYVMSIWLGDGGQNYDHKPEVLRLSVVRDGSEGLRPPPEINGCLDWRGDWSSAPVDEASKPLSA